MNVAKNRAIYSKHFFFENILFRSFLLSTRLCRLFVLFFCFTGYFVCLFFFHSVSVFCFRISLLLLFFFVVVSLYLCFSIFFV